MTEVQVAKFGHRSSSNDSAISNLTPDTVATEEPLEIRIRHHGLSSVGEHGNEAPTAKPVAVVMRTPGDDFDLAWGLAITEGIVGRPEDILSAHWGEPADFNAVELRLDPTSILAEVATGSAWLVNSSCGLCGKDAIESIVQATQFLGDIDMKLQASALGGFTDSLRDRQEIFSITGGLHGAGAFEADGSVVCVREDIGRHNAVDKVIGHLAKTGRLPAHDIVLAVSGRAGFEIVNKAAIAGIPVVIAVSAPSSLAVELAERLGMTLAGFVRQAGANIYCGQGRLR